MQATNEQPTAIDESMSGLPDNEIRAAVIKAMQDQQNEQPTAIDMSMYGMPPNETRAANAGLAMMMGSMGMGMICCSVCCIGLIFAVDIACIVIGFQDNWECDGKGAVVKDLHTFAKMAGFMSFGLAFLSVIIQLYVFPPMKGGVPSLGNIKKIQYMQGLWGLLFVILSIIGFVEYGSTSKDCQQAPLGEVVLAWAILKILGPIILGCSAIGGAGKY